MSRENAHADSFPVACERGITFCDRKFWRTILTPFYRTEWKKKNDSNICLMLHSAVISVTREIDWWFLTVRRSISENNPSTLVEEKKTPGQLRFEQYFGSLPSFFPGSQTLPSVDTCLVGPAQAKCVEDSWHSSGRRCFDADSPAAANHEPLESEQWAERPMVDGKTLTEGVRSPQ